MFLIDRTALVYLSKICAHDEESGFGGTAAQMRGIISMPGFDPRQNPSLRPRRPHTLQGQTLPGIQPRAASCASL